MPKTKQVKREEAAARQAHWDSLSVEHKLLDLSLRPGFCLKQTQKLVRKEPK